MIKQLIKNLVRWALQGEIQKLNLQLKQAAQTNDTLNQTNDTLSRYIRELHKTLEGIDISIEVNEERYPSRSWAVISLQGKKTDFVKFVDLGDREVSEIAHFVEKYDRRYNVKVDASMFIGEFLRIKK